MEIFHDTLFKKLLLALELGLFEILLPLLLLDLFLKFKLHLLALLLFLLQHDLLLISATKDVSMLLQGDI